jgi:hypothetical protein
MKVQQWHVVYIWYGSNVLVGIIFPAGPYMVDGEAEDQPWRQACQRRDIKVYFEEVHSDLTSLKIGPAPRAGEWNSAVIYGGGPEGQVRYTQHYIPSTTD